MPQPHTPGGPATPPPPDEIFTTGHMNSAVARIGTRIHRAASPQSPTILRLLTHVRAQGVGWVPAHHGFDAQGREVLDFIPGEVVHDAPPWQRDIQVVRTVARALREWHDATATFERSPVDVWWQPDIAPADVICHVDFAPYNHVFRDRQFVGAIDFDLCTPGPRVWDLAYTAYRYIPLTPARDELVPDGPSPDRSDFNAREQRERLEAFVAAYGFPDITANAVLATLPARLDAMAQWCAGQESAALQRNAIMYQAHARWAETGPLAG